MIRKITLFALAVTAFGAQAQFPNWTKLNYDYSPDRYSAIDRMNVAVTADDQIYAFTIRERRPVDHSTDGGNTWNTLIDGKYLLNVMPDNQGGLYRVNYRNKVYPDSVFHSTDNGATWNFVSVSTNRRVNLQYYYNTQGIHYLHRIDNRGTVYLGEGQDGENFKYSSDNGATWTTVTCPTQPFSALVASDGTIYITTYNSGIFVSTDNGTNWDNSGYSGTTTAFNLMEHPVTGEVYVLVAGMAITKTSDQGQSWDPVASRPNVSPIKKMHITADGMFYLQTSKEVFESEDGVTYDEILTYNSNIDFVKDMSVSDQYVYAQVDSSLYRYQRKTGGGTTALDESQALKAALYPNPSAGSFHLETEGDATAVIYSLTGQKIREYNFTYKLQIDLAEQPRGSYMLHLRHGDGSSETHLLIRE